jgi:predicted GNAT superfamily acetyltransferase
MYLEKEGFAVHGAPGRDRDGLESGVQADRAVASWRILLVGKLERPQVTVQSVLGQ